MILRIVASFDSTYSAHRVLNGKDIGTFLVRMSAHPEHACVMSVVTGQNGVGSIAHCTVAVARFA